MPFYDYQCEKCSHIQEVYHSMFDVNVEPCQKCKHTLLTRLFSPPAVQVVGTTIGSIGEKNYKALSSDEKAKLDKPKYEEKHPLIKKAATKSDVEIMGMSKERQLRYVMEGR